MENLENDVQLLKLRLGQENYWENSLSSDLPVGTILPWLNRLQTPDGQFKLSPDLPPLGWQLCDGQVGNILWSLRGKNCLF